MQMTRVLTVALILAGSSLAQSAGVSKWPDIGLFGGYQGWDLWRSKFNSRPGGELAKGGVAGLRLGYDITGHFSVEGAYIYGVNNFRALPDQTGGQRLQSLELGARNHSLSLNPVWNFGASGSKLRPYVTAGLGGITFAPTSAAGASVRTGGASFGAAGVKNDLMPAFNWGGGIKYNLTQLLQLRFDARNIITRQPHIGLPPQQHDPGRHLCGTGRHGERPPGHRRLGL